MALASGYGHYAVATTESGIKEAWLSLAHKKGPCFLEIKVAIGSRVNLGRPNNTPKENKNNFMNWLVAQ
nr:hypothetical protein [Paenalcaligenes hominis]